MSKTRMVRKSTIELLREIDEVSRAKKITRKGMAKKLDIPYSTYKKWFYREGARRIPSPAYIEKIEKFLESQKEKSIYWKDLWLKILKWWETQHRYASIRELADDIGWDVQNLSNYFQNKEMPPRLVIEKIAKTIGFEIPALNLMLREAQRKAGKVKYLLLFLEEELRWFRDGAKEARDVFRGELDPNDTGYISSLLTMLSEEDKFRRWLTLTTNRFNFFKEKIKEK